MFGFGRKKKDKPVQRQTAAQRRSGRNSPEARRAAAKASTSSRPARPTKPAKEPTSSPRSPRTTAKTTPASKQSLRKERQAKTTMAVNASKVTGSTKTKGGTYKTFAKNSSAAKDFRSAFAAARAENKRLKKAGKPEKKTFTWNGKRYKTETK